MEKFAEFENKIGVQFKDRAVLREAFTHRSYINETRERGLDHNERLEFLGDAVVELVVTNFLYKKYPQANEGDLTSYRAALVNAVTLGNLAIDMGMEEFLLLSKGEAKDKGTKARQIILANAFEAVVGAIYLDLGYETAEQFLKNHLLGKTEEIVKKELWRDAKSFFQEEAQEHVGVTPSYRVISEEGPDHDKDFNVGVYLNDELVGQGIGKSKQDAEQVAAADGLKKKGWAK
ncbi:MAG: Ribonuclease 3 [Parcubacteria group bacterium GW2011_GWA1_44_13]|uniref:Ribonuclease 3 n=1 Tax=Candidatus Nomurabacteria bacterium GW2011_GWB1_44_12 TaxID=1618748 RepID=A0A837I8N6_9BACT|nr:MAG: Ribonuclease 3 [Candidatus Nomurabacteria bacterium GW2011_GWD1_44_10]KKT37219.1 MAG: Ribonuclease 3 [Candidatus Nomurabacteria bacterium GW2011_GWB1_44_12]KKT38530.1 MAG: Ribonuclease 3 [Parcubacteria group bacterium GW2011_GWA1_44_13]KKT60930.1 MAG: Ribonuclease 3 [Parcubacteria group bacterium GW2011_GWC1_44_26]HBB44471.1 ribonuclease III [Candidatus Yonathbacteria bacterium]